MSQSTNQKIEQLLDQNPVFLFMKGSPQAPMCGFSSNTVQILKSLINEEGFGSFNVLEDQEMREGIKQYGQWPTIPQLYVNKELVGGNDIVTEMFNTGELHQLLGLPQPDKTPPEISISEKAAEHIKEGMQDAAGHALFLNIDDSFNTRFSLEKPKGYEIVSDVTGIRIHMDIATAKRAQGMEIDWIDELQGSGLSIRNPNEPPAVKHISVDELKTWMDADKEQPLIFDVRSPESIAAGTVTGAVRLDKEKMQEIEAMEKDTALVFVCQIGQSSQAAAEFFRKKGFTNLHNLTGGYNAWSA
ncbi:Grx4 family monothiol glutaredoxin [Marinicella sp. W31]|uniref:Grx4 family monothiol glutaredoxin n=1 Tax=Marinicella sp. W31 TaxID=3023713 RepID=UPI003757A051